MTHRAAIGGPGSRAGEPHGEPIDPEAAADAAFVRRCAEQPWDVIVVGGGNAALVAALSAREQARRVLVLERAPRHARGGNTRHTRNIRVAHLAADGYVTGRYPAGELMADLVSVGDGPVNLDLARLAVAGSVDCPRWMAAQGVRWQQPLRGTLSLARTNRFFLGGGKALLNRYYATAEQRDVRVAYRAHVTGIEAGRGGIDGVVVRTSCGPALLRARAFVMAAGGFEANLEWLRRYWGDAVDNYVIRGTPFNDGTVLARLLEMDAATAGDPKGFHAIALDARAPRFDGGIATRTDSIPFGVVVDRAGRRFADEGADLWPKRYASWGRLVAEQEGQIAFSIYDSAVARLFIPGLYPPYTAPTISGLAEAIGTDPRQLVATIDQFNASVEPAGRFSPTELDGCGTTGLVPPKSNWARALAAPPFYAVPLRPGITFTYLGVAVSDRAAVLDRSGTPFRNVFAAGEIMSGNILSTGYLAGFGLTIGTVFGRIAGREAARCS